MMITMKAFQYLAPIAPFDYVRPNSVEELLNALSQYGSKAKLIAGGTDLTIALKERLIHPEVVIDLNHLRANLSGIEVTKTSLKIGSMTTYTELELDPNVQRYARALSEAASQVGTYQIRNLGTIGANLANGSPAADTAPPLIVLSANVNLQSKLGKRKVPIEKFFTGVKKTALGSDEILEAIVVPASSAGARGAYRKLKRIAGHDLGIVGVALSRKDGLVKIGISSSAPTPILVEGLEEGDSVDKVAAAAREAISPISDVRCSKEYREFMVETFVKRLMREVA